MSTNIQLAPLSPKRVKVTAAVAASTALAILLGGSVLKDLARDVPVDRTVADQVPAAGARSGAPPSLAAADDRPSSPAAKKPPGPDAVTSYLRGKHISGLQTWQVVPGVHYHQWDQADARGTNRAHLLRIDPTTPGLSIDYASASSVRQDDTVRHIVTHDRAVAGINGDFYDIGDTGAPLGLGVDRKRGLLHARHIGWNHAFAIEDGKPVIDRIPMVARITEQPRLRITHLNSPLIFDDQIGVYDWRWGLTAGSRVVEGQTSHVRQVVIQRGRVVSNGPTLSSGEKVDGTILVGRGAGADALTALKKGQEAHLHFFLAGDPEVAITGNAMLLAHGVRGVVDDVEMHPRTAIGIDHDTGHVLMLVVDGRQSFSRGLTMVEAADLMRALGAEDAVNLDGGGSSTMVGLGRDGALATLNSPSDGFERRVADGLEINYLPPSTAGQQHGSAGGPS